MTNSVSVLGIPLDHNSSHLRGPSEAPAKIWELLECGAMNWSTENGLDLSKVDTFKNVGNLEWESEGVAFKVVENTVNKLISEGQRVLSLGGDHSVTLPIIKAYAKHYDDLTILHFDAHSDLYHNFEGNPYSHASPFARIMESEYVSRLVQVGIRTLCEHQREQVEKFNVDVIEMKDWSIERFKSLNVKGNVYISFDLDGLDPSCAPGVSHHEPGGLMMREVLTLIQGLNVNLVGADVVEYNPRQDFSNHMTGFVAAKLVKELAAKMMG